MRFAALVPVIVSLCAACGGDTPTSPTSTTPANAVERFDDIINPKESKFYPFSVGSSGTTTINLASLSPVDRPGVITATMEIGWGKTVKDDDGNVVGCAFIIELAFLRGRARLEAPEVFSLISYAGE